MKTNTTTPDSKGFRFPSESISHAVWLYFRFSLRFRDGEEILAHRGIVVTDETVGQWCLKFGQTYANELRRRPRCGDKWHMDEMVLTRGGKKHSGWRAVHQDGNVLDILVQSRSNTKAATGFFRKLLKGLHSVPRVMIPAKLKRYAAAQRDIVPGGGIATTSDPTTELRTHLSLHDDGRRKGDGSHRQNTHNAFSLLIAPSAGHFQPRRHGVRAKQYRALLQARPVPGLQ